MIIVRMDPAYYAAGVLHAIRRAGARFSVTVPLNAAVRAAIAAVPERAWTAIRYPRAIFDDQLGCWVSEAEVAETSYTAFTGRPAYRWQHDVPPPIGARLSIRRVKDQNTAAGRSAAPQTSRKTRIPATQPPKFGRWIQAKCDRSN